MCDNCKSDVLDPAVAIAQVKALRKALQRPGGEPKPTLDDIARIAWPEIWIRAEDASKVAIVAGEPVEFGQGDVAIVFHGERVERLRVIPTQRTG